MIAQHQKKTFFQNVIKLTFFTLLNSFAFIDCTCMTFNRKFSRQETTRTTIGGVNESTLNNANAYLKHALKHLNYLIENIFLEFWSNLIVKSRLFHRPQYFFFGRRCTNHVGLFDLLLRSLAKPPERSVSSSSLV